MDIQSMSEFVLFRVVLGTLGIAVFGIIFGLLYKGIDRKIAAHMQGRIGPPIRQPFRDIVKLFTKENIVPENAIPWIFNLVPLVGLVATISILLYLPLGGFSPLLSQNGDLILILYLLIIPSLAMVVGGFSSGSPYAVVGAQREMATMIAYEFPLAIIIISIATRL
ncbi:MAG: NADH-quinone oxidoreductase subunit H, partial [Thermoplasmatales archaeon]|nr:NADH-quinone oxidoreductase subunit H [Thermoplasmatales archaeon]